MGKRRYELDTRILTIFFFVAMPFVAFGSFLVVSMARNALLDSLEVSFEQRAAQTRYLLERYVGDQVVALRLTALDPQVRAALGAPAPPSSAEDTRKLDQAWASGQDRRLTNPILASPLARRLHEIVQVRPAIRLLEVVDGSGRLVAASSRSGRLAHADAPWFKGLVAEAAERPWVGDIHRPTSTQLAVLELAYPIYDSEARLQGALRALLDATDLYSVIAPVRVGKTGHAILLRSTDGMVLASDDTTRVLTQPYPGFGQLQAAMERRLGSWTLRAGGGGGPSIGPPRVVGFAPVEQVSNVKWLVVVEQELSEASAPVQQVTRFLWVHFIGAFGSVILLALYFSFKLETPVIEDALHLHEEHLPARMRGPGQASS